MPHPLQPLWTSHTRDPEPLLSPGVPLGCSAALQSVRHSRAGRLRAPNEESPHSHVVTSPRRHSSRSRPTSPTASPWAAQWACGSSQLEFDQHLTTASPQGPKAVVVGCASPSTADLLHLPWPRNGLVGHRRRSRPTFPTAIHKTPERSH